MLPVLDQRFNAGSKSSAVGVRCMSGPYPPATSTLPSRRRAAVKPMRLVCMAGTLPQLSPAEEARNTWVSLTPYAPGKPVAMSTRPSASNVTICASPRDGGPAGVATPDQRPYATGVGEGGGLVVAASGASVLEGVAGAVAACVGAGVGACVRGGVAVAVAAGVGPARGLEAAGAPPPRSRPAASSSHTALGVTSRSTWPGEIPLQALGGEVVPNDRLAQRHVANGVLGGRARLPIFSNAAVELQ